MLLSIPLLTVLHTEAGGAYVRRLVHVLYAYTCKLQAYTTASQALVISCPLVEWRGDGASVSSRVPGAMDGYDMLSLADRSAGCYLLPLCYGATASGYDHACMAWALRAYRIPIGLEASQRSAVDKIPVASWMCMRARGLSPVPEPIHMACLMWYRMEKAVAPPPEIGAGLRGGCSLERSLV